MYAIFRAKGKQFRAEPEATLRLPSLDAEPGDQITFDEVLLASADGQVRVGTPALSGASVAAEVLRHGKGEKIVVFKMKRRKNYRRKQGHRQKFTEVRIVGIELPAAEKRKAEKEPAKTEKKEPAPEPEKPAPAGKGADKPEGLAEQPEPAASAEVDVTDAARDLAEQHGIDLATLEGTGKEGRILKSDVEGAIQARADEDAEGSDENEEGT